MVSPPFLVRWELWSALPYLSHMSSVLQWVCANVMQVRWCLLVRSWWLHLLRRARHRSVGLTFLTLLMVTACKALNILLLTILVLLNLLSDLMGPFLTGVLRGNCGRTLVLVCIGIGIADGLLS